MPLAFKRKAIALNQLFLPAMSSPHNTLKIHTNSTLLLLAWSAETRSCNTHYNGKKAKLPQPALTLWAEPPSDSSWVQQRETQGPTSAGLPRGPSEGNWGAQPALLKQPGKAPAMLNGAYGLDLGMEAALCILFQEGREWQWPKIPGNSPQCPGWHPGDFPSLFWEGYPTLSNRFH